MTQWSSHQLQRGPVRRWVGAGGSLSAWLARAGEKFTVQVIRQGRQRLRAEEARALRLSGVREGYVREVVLRVDERAVVIARSVTSFGASLGPWRAIRGLGIRPLADVLFRRVAAITRQPLEFAILQPATPLRGYMQRAWQKAIGAAPGQRAMPARRSVFTRKGAPLLVMEVFAGPESFWSSACSAPDRHRMRQKPRAGRG